MERNLGLFEGWRAKRREKKKEELERLSAMKVETGVLSKYLKLRSQESREGLNSFGEIPSSGGTSGGKEKESTKSVSLSSEKEVQKGAKSEDAITQRVFEGSSEDLNSCVVVAPVCSTRQGTLKPFEENDTELQNTKTAEKLSVDVGVEKLAVNDLKKNVKGALKGTSSLQVKMAGAPVARSEASGNSNTEKSIKSIEKAKLAMLTEVSDVGGRKAELEPEVRSPREAVSKEQNTKFVIEAGTGCTGSENKSQERQLKTTHLGKLPTRRIDGDFIGRLEHPPLGSIAKAGESEALEKAIKAKNSESKTDPPRAETCRRNTEQEAGKSEPPKKCKKAMEGGRKMVVKPDNWNINSPKDLLRSTGAVTKVGVSKELKKAIGTDAEHPSKEKLLDGAPEREENKSVPITASHSKISTPRQPNESLRREVIQEAVKFQESLTLLTERANQIGCEAPTKDNQLLFDPRSEDPCLSKECESESLSLRKDPKKLQRKLKCKPNPNERYPETQKLLTTKPVNAFQQAKLDQSKKESIVRPSKVEAFLRDTLSGDREAVVEEILTSTSDKSTHEKPSRVSFTSRGEVICGVVSIRPSSKEDVDGLSAITLVPAFRPETSAPDKTKNEGTSDYFSEASSMEKVKVTDSPKLVREEHKEPERERFSPVSDDDSYDHYIPSVDCSLDSSYSWRRSLRSSSTPRRMFPQMAKLSPYRSDRTKEDSPVVFDAGLSFDICSNRTSLRHRFKPQPAFTDRKTSSSSLSMRISDFLKRTDHIMDEWKHLGKGGENLQDLVQVASGKASRSKNATNIMIRGLLNYSKGSGTPSLRSRSQLKTSEASDRTISDIDELSEMALDLSEERATGTIQAERLEAETAERVRLEQELTQVQSEKKNLQQTSERLEMELFYARADVNGLSESEADLEDGGGDASLYKNKCQRAMRELEFTRRRLQQQHEDDLEQLVALKKQLEKKLADAYEEVEEQRQVAAQWKRKVQKLQSETNDLRLLLEDQNSRNNLLEKKQRKFDSEIQILQEELRSERNQKERSSREREIAVAEKYSLEQNLGSVRLELELKEEKVSALSRELEELSRGGGTEQEVTQLRKAKHDLEMKIKEQEEELDELAGQVSMLEGNKLRLEMSLESLRKEHRREMAQRDDELDEVRANGQKKIKVLESQLESEHEERTLLVREKHELERRLADAEERDRHHRAADEDALQRARRDLKKTKALLRDAQIMLERVKQDSPSKAALRALKNQLEDIELARASAVKAKQSLEAELSEVTGQLEEALRAKGDAENRCQSAVREMNSLRTQVDENEEELAELLKKYRQTVQQLSAEQLANQETAGALAEAEAERASLRDQLVEMSARLEANAGVDPMNGLTQKKLEIRIKELESRLELEQTTRGRLEVQITRLKENMERLNDECVQARTKEQGATDLTRKLQKSLREAKEELAAHQAKEQEAAHKNKELEKRLEAAEGEASTARTDLRLAVKRIEDLQLAISGEIGSDSDKTDSEDEDSENDSLVSHVPSTISSTSRTSRTPELTPR